MKLYVANWNWKYLTGLYNIPSWQVMFERTSWRWRTVWPVWAIFLKMLAKHFLTKVPSPNIRRLLGYFEQHGFWVKTPVTTFWLTIRHFLCHTDIESRQLHHTTPQRNYLYQPHHNDLPFVLFHLRNCCCKFVAN